MNYIAVTTTIMLRIHLCHQCSDAVRLTNRLNEFFHFDHQIIFVDTATERYGWLPMSSSTCNTTLASFMPQTVYTFYGDADTRNSNITTIKTKISNDPLLVVVVDPSKFENDSQLVAQVKVVRSIYVNVKIGIFFTHNIRSLDIVEQWFRWSWSAGIVNIFCAFHFHAEDGEPSFNVFKYDPLGMFYMVNVTSIESLQDYFPDKVPNYRKQPIQFQVINGQTIFIEMDFWNTVIGIFNASMSRIYNSQDEFEQIEIINKDIALNEALLTNYSQAFYLYPIRESTLLLIVPHAKPYSDFVAYLQNGTWARLIVFTFILIATSSLLLIVSRHLQQDKILLFQCVTDVVNLLINDNRSIRYGNLHRADVFVIVPLTFTGLIAMNGVVSLFKSYLTTPIYQPQIHTLTDLYKASIPILVNELAWEDKTIEILEGITKHGGWSNKVHGTTLQQLRKEIQTFNSSKAFLVYDDEAPVYIEAQKLLGLKAYHMLSERFIGNQLVSFKISSEFPFIEQINTIIHWLNDAGLIDKWMKENTKSVMKILWERILSHQYQTDALSDIGKFSIPTVVWLGWIVSTIAFICEIIWNKVKTFNSGSENQGLMSENTEKCL